MSRQIFISYSQPDKAVAEGLCQSLESSGLTCWIAPRNIEAGTDWTTGIMDGISGCQCMVLVFSSKANESVHVGREIMHATEQSRRVFPFRVELVEPTGRLSYCLTGMQWFDATTPPIERHIAMLTAQLKELLQPDSVAPPVAEATAQGEDIEFDCPSCGQELAIDSSHAGSQGECPKCKQRIGFPRASEAVEVPVPVPSPAPTPSVAPAAPAFSLAPEVLDQLSIALAEHIGPIAKTVVARTVSKCQSSSELLNALAAEVDSSKDRESFQRAAAALIPS